MKILPKSTAKFCMPLFVVCMTILFTNSTQAQKQYTTISKNINPEAQNLYHDLSKQGDTLYLKAESIFYKVTFLNSLDRKVYTFNPPVLEAKIPLHDIIVGDYTILVYKKDRIIAFHISRLLEIEKPSEMIVSKGLSIPQDILIIKPVLPRLNSKERPNSRMATNEIKMDENFELGMEDLKVAVNDDNLNVSKSNLLNEPRSYNLSSMDRTNMQSREEYRRNNVRPNGKPYH